jgi:hypothetical protein
VRESQTLQVRIAASDGGTLPFGQDRLVPLLLATEAVHWNSRTISLGPAYAILKRFGIAANGRDYLRLAHRFRRVFSVTLNVRSTVEPHPEQQYRIVEHQRLWFDARGAQSRFDNVVTLSHGFWNELQTHRVCFPFQAARQLLASPGSLDLYLWLVYRAARVRQGRFAKVPLFGTSGLAGHFGSAEYSQPRDFRNKLRAWLRRIREVWPECPALFSSAGNELLVWHRDMPTCFPSQANIMK